MTQPRATFSLTLDGRDLTAEVRPRLISASLAEARSGEADQLDLVLDASDGRLAIPRQGVAIDFGLGWAAGGAPLVEKGRFTVDEVGHEGTPDRITLTARSANFTADLRLRQERAWTGTTLGAVLRQVAQAHGLEPRIAPALDSTPLAVLQQSRESDAAFLARLGRRFDATATVKGDRLLFLPIGGSQTAGGAALPSFQIARSDQDGHSYKVPKRDDYDGVSATWHETAAGKRHLVHAGGDGRRKKLRGVFASEADAQQFATAEAARIKRDASTLSLHLALGRPDLFPELQGAVSGFLPEIDAKRWMIDKATHALDGDGGLRTDLELVIAP